MRKSLFITFLLLVTCLTVRAQRFALIDMEYILRNIPAYESANQQLEQSSISWRRRRSPCMKIIRRKLLH